MRAVVGVLLAVVCVGCAGGQRPKLITEGGVEAQTAPTTTEAATTTTEAPTTTLAPEPTTTIPEATTIPAPARYLQPVTTSRCGGDLPPCYVMDRESRGDISVYNYSGSGASGKWQIMPSTWGGYRGYANAADAPESVQDERARQLWDGGRGCAHWNAC